MFIYTLCVKSPEGVLTYKMGMYVPPYVKKKEAYGAEQTEKVGAFRTERTVRADRTGRNVCIQKKWVLLELIEMKKWVHPELIKLKTAAHTRTALIWEYRLRG